MEPIKVVVRYANGRVIKGFTQDFFPNKDRFHLYPAAKPSGEATEVLVKELKAHLLRSGFRWESPLSGA